MQSSGLDAVSLDLSANSLSFQDRALMTATVPYGWPICNPDFVVNVLKSLTIENGITTLFYDTNSAK